LLKKLRAHLASSAALIAELELWQEKLEKRKPFKRPQPNKLPDSGANQQNSTQ
jgi:hypothetical protein